MVALIEDEATVKRYYPEGDRIRFQPANATMQPIYVNKAEFRSTMIWGRSWACTASCPAGGTEPRRREFAAFQRQFT